MSENVPDAQVDVPSAETTSPPAETKPEATVDVTTSSPDSTQQAVAPEAAKPEAVADTETAKSVGEVVEKASEEQKPEVKAEDGATKKDNDTTAVAATGAEDDVTEAKPEAVAEAVPAAAEELEAPRVVIVTGASSGIGYNTARSLCARHHDVILACRNEQKAQRAIDKIRRETPDAKATYMQLDLADLESVRTFVKNFEATGKQLSVLVNNAGLILSAKDTKLQWTKENFELTMATNHLGHFLLTNLLRENLKKSAAELGGARVVVVTSALHDSAVARKKGGAAVQPLDVDDLFLYKEGAYNGMQAYKNSKLANVMFTYELARQFGDSGVKVNAIDPGFVPTTELLRHSNGAQKFYQRYILHGLLRFTKQTRSASQAGQEVCMLAVSEKFKDMTGKYVHGGQESKSSDESLDEALQKKLWELSARYVQLDGYEPLTATPPAPPTPKSPVPAASNGKADKEPVLVAVVERAEATESTETNKKAGGDAKVEDKKDASSVEQAGTTEAPKSAENGGDEAKVASEIVSAVVETAVKDVAAAEISAVKEADNGDVKPVENGEVSNGNSEEKAKDVEQQPPVAVEAQ